MNEEKKKKKMEPKFKPRPHCLGNYSKFETLTEKIDDFANPQSCAVLPSRAFGMRGQNTT